MLSRLFDKMYLKFVIVIYYIIELNKIGNFVDCHKLQPRKIHHGEFVSEFSL
jgi:hypothetical protein